MLADEDTRSIYRRFLDQQGSASGDRSASGFLRTSLSRATGINVIPVSRQSTTASTSSATTPEADAGGHRIQASGWTAAPVSRKSGTATTLHVYLVPSASEPLREGFVRVINHSAEAGEVRIDPVDDSGRQFDTITLSIDANQTVHFNSGDLETGNEGKGLAGSTGSGEGDWRLAFASELDIEVLAYIRTTDGFLTAMHDVVPREGGIGRVAIFNPGSNKNQVSRLRLINPTNGTAEVTIRGTDDKGMSGTGEVSLLLDAGSAREITAGQLEEGATGLAGMLGDGSGKWRLEVESEQAVVAMSLLESPTDHLTNLSTVPAVPEDGVHSVPLFPAAGDASGRQGFVRVINGSATSGEVTIRAYDESQRDYEPITLTIGANAVVHFNSDDLEQGNTGKGLSGGTGAGDGDWRLQLESDLDFEVLSYIRTDDGFLTAMHDVVPSAGMRHRVAVFNPGSNRNQESLLRLINPADATAEVTVTGIDGNGAPGAGAVTLSVPAGGSRTVGAWDLESGTEGLDGALGDGAGKWQLMIESGRPVVAMSLLRSPTGHLTNLSTAPVRGARGGAVQEPGTAEAVFRQLISGPIVQSKCVSCHVEGGASGNTRLVFGSGTDEAVRSANLQVFRDFLDEVEDGADYVLNKIQGALGHGGGIQVAAGTDEYADVERFLGLLGGDVGPIAITPDTLFDGVAMESPRQTLRRAAIVFAGRTPTDEEYESIIGGTQNDLREAIRGLMQGTAFHRFLIRAANDRLFTDRDLEAEVIPRSGEFVAYTNKLHRLIEEAGGDPEDAPAAWGWVGGVQFGASRAPLELIAHVVENDLPYTEVVSANYIMANPFAADAYGAPTAFDNPSDVHEFKPSEIVSYYADDETKEVRVAIEKFTIMQVTDSGNRQIDYPHAGILNTTAFMLRYPSTATNRNRARSRWTYYHFLGVDVENSASRTTDPVALADTNNPTLHNPACTVCHTVLDPVAGAFQNYGDAGLYRDQPGGLDSLDEFYKDDLAGTDLEIHAPSDSSRETADIATASGRLSSGAQEIGLSTVNEGDGGSNIHVDYLKIRDESGAEVGHYELEELADADSDRAWDGKSFEICCEVLIVPVEIPSDGMYTVEVGAWLGYQWGDGEGGPGTLRISIGGQFYRYGDTWYRDMRAPGFDGRPAPNPDDSVRWLGGQIAADHRFSESAVKFWWPAIMGSEIAEPPEAESDAGFEGLLLAAAAQEAEVKRLAGGFRRGFRAGDPYNLKDLLVEMVLSNWFRADSLDGGNTVQAVALAGTGARRLLTPAELAAKTLAVTGFEWGRRRPGTYVAPWDERKGVLVDPMEGYGLLYGGIDSDGVTERARDITSVMAGVAQTHAFETSCPVVLREFFLLPEEDRRLFAGIDESVTPVSEFGGSFEIAGASRSEIGAFSVEGALTPGRATVKIHFLNDFWDEELGDRNVVLDRMTIRQGATVVHELEFEDLDPPQGCHHYIGDDAFTLYESGSECVLAIEWDVSMEGTHRIEVQAWGDQAGGQRPIMNVAVETDPSRAAGARMIRAKLSELYAVLHGVELGPDSQEVLGAYDLFVDLWERKRVLASEYGAHFLWNENDVRCEWASDEYYLDGIADHLWQEDLDEYGNAAGWDWDGIHRYFEGLNLDDRNGVVRTWSVVLAYFLMDYRYLYL